MRSEKGGRGVREERKEGGREKGGEVEEAGEENEER